MRKRQRTTQRSTVRRKSRAYWDAMAEEEFRRTGDPMFVWMQLGDVLAEQRRLPAWMAAYLGRVSDALGQLMTSDTVPGQKQIAPAVCRALEFYRMTGKKKLGRLNPFRLDDHDAYIAREVHRKIRDGLTEPQAIKAVKHEHPDVCERRIPCTDISVSKVRRAWQRHQKDSFVLGQHPTSGAPVVIRMTARYRRRLAAMPPGE
jgi:hypothetical protein